MVPFLQIRKRLKRVSFKCVPVSSVYWLLLHFPPLWFLFIVSCVSWCKACAYLENVLQSRNNHNVELRLHEIVEKQINKHLSPLNMWLLSFLTWRYVHDSCHWGSLFLLGVDMQRHAAIRAFRGSRVWGGELPQLRSVYFHWPSLTGFIHLSQSGCPVCPGGIRLFGCSFLFVVRPHLRPGRSETSVLINSTWSPLHHQEIVPSFNRRWWVMAFGLDKSRIEYCNSKPTCWSANGVQFETPYNISMICGETWDILCFDFHVTLIWPFAQHSLVSLRFTVCKLKERREQLSIAFRL